MDASARSPNRIQVHPIHGAAGTEPPPDKETSYTIREETWTERQRSVIREWLTDEDANPLFGIAQSQLYGYVMGVSLFIALFFPDLWVICNIADNSILDIILLVVLFSFTVEIVINCVTSPGYFLGFWFLADVIGAISLLFDMTLAFGVSDEPMREEFGGGSEQLVLLRSARAAKIGARAGRFSRVIRLLKWLPGMQHQKHEVEVETAQVMFNAIMTALSTRVAMLTLILVVIMPLFQLNTYPAADYSMRIWTESFPEWAARGFPVQKDIARLQAFYESADYKPFVLRINDSVWNLASPPARVANEFRLTQGSTEIAFDFTTPMQLQSVINVLLMVMVIAVMILFALLLSNNISTLVLLPLEQLLMKVRAVSDVIFKSVAMHENSHRTGRNRRDFERKERARSQMNETELLERAVAKLTVMSELAVATKAGVSEAYLAERNINTHDDMACIEYLQGTKSTIVRHASVGAVNAYGKDSPPPGLDESQRTSSFTGLLAQDGTPLDHAQVMQILSKSELESLCVDTWDFNALELSPDQLRATMMYFFCSSSQQCKYVSRATMLQFIKTAEGGYNSPQYHCWFHAVDTTHGVYRQLCLTDAKEFLGNVARFALLVSAVCHDIGHPGMNNPFLVDTRHELAVRYNDISPLENHHCAKLFEICTQESSNVFAKLSSEQYKDARKIAIEAILHTDMKHHFQMVKDVQMLFQINEDALNHADSRTEVIKAMAQDADIRIKLMQLILHSADISNSGKPFEICRAWSQRVLEEFFAQGDQEKELGLAVQMLNDRDKVNRPHSQIGFIDFVVSPLMLAQMRMFPELRATGEFLVDNHKRWIGIWTQDYSPQDKDRDDMLARNTKLNSTFQSIFISQTPRRSAYSGV